MFFAPVDRDPAQSLVMKREPCLFKFMSPKGAFEMSKRTCAVDGVLEVVANYAGLSRQSEVLHDRPVVDIELRG